VAPAVAAICAAEEMRGHAITAQYRLDPDGTRARYFGENGTAAVADTSSEPTSVPS
jgi:hypothetical protein